MKQPSFLKRLVCVFIFCFYFFFLPNAQTVKDSTTILFTIDTVAKNLGYPWEILYGPDDSLWITEARGYRVVRMSKNRTTAQKNLPVQQVLKLPLGSALVSFDRSIGTWPQGGMQGLVLHPDFKKGTQYAYLSYVYGGTCPASSSGPCYFRSKIVRCRFYYASDAGNPSVRVPKQDSLIIVDTVISNLPGSSDHNSGRLAISPVKEGPDNTYKLYYTIGDMGAGQFSNATRINQAQNKDTCEGKILRLNTEPDADGDPATPIHDYDRWRKWIPNDNPFTHSVAAFSTLRTPVYSYGHRNAQGIVWGKVNGIWRLYSSEHGDKSDDETNIIEAGGNYGWPKVSGMPDDNYSSTDAFTNNDQLASINVTWSESAISILNNMKRPQFCFFNMPAASFSTINNNQVFTWPTIAPSSIDFYDGNIPGWRNSLLITSLKYGMYRMKLNNAGDYIDSSCSVNMVDTFPLLHGWRIRDVAINPKNNSGQFWVITDSTGSTSGPTGGFTGANTPTKDGGKILMLTYKSIISLPITFVSFNGLLNKQQVELQWQASTNNNHKWFEVERSPDGEHFTMIGKLMTNTSKFIDFTPAVGRNYYRIKIVSVDAADIYSDVISILYEANNFVLKVYPNPVKDLLRIKINQANTRKSKIEIFDSKGILVFAKMVAASAYNNEILVNTAAWPSQVYHVTLYGSLQEVIGKKVFIKL